MSPEAVRQRMWVSMFFGCIRTRLPLYLHFPGEVKSIIIKDAVKPLNNGHIGTSHNYLSFIERLSFLLRLKYTSIIEK